MWAETDPHGPTVESRAPLACVFSDPAMPAPTRNSPSHDGGRSSGPWYLFPNANRFTPPTGLSRKAKNWRQLPGAAPPESRTSRDRRKATSPTMLPPKGVFTWTFMEGGWVSATCSQISEPMNATAHEAQKLSPSVRPALKLGLPCSGCMSEFAQKSSVSMIHPLLKFWEMLSALIFAYGFPDA